jgi:SOS-response transcriptional repressor LexA
MNNYNKSCNITSMEIKDRIKSSRKLVGLNQSELARAIETSPQTVQQWEAGKTSPKGDNLLKLSYALKVTPEWLQTGKEPRKEPTYNLADDSLELPKRRLAPIISYVQAGSWCELVDAYPVGIGEDSIAIDAKWSPNTFVLRVRGDSMHPTLTEGSLIVVDPQVEWMHNRIVVVRQHGDAEVTVKRLIKDGDTYYLKPDNTTYPLLKLEKDAHVCGVVVEQLTRFL